MLTIRTYKDNGPYWDATKMSYQAASLRDILFHTRLAMADAEDVIAVFNEDGSCKGIWNREIEGHVDSAGDCIVDHEGYELMRPDTREQWMWNRLIETVS